MLVISALFASFLICPSTSAAATTGDFEFVPQESNGTKAISYQSAACYDQFNGYGSIFNIHDPINDLTYYGWDNRISSCCFNGFWLLYEDKNYNKYYPNAMVYYGYGDNHCRNFDEGFPSFNNRASSVRYSQYKFVL